MVLCGQARVLAIKNPPGYPVLLAGLFVFARDSGLGESAVYSGFALCCIALASTFVFLMAESIWGIRGALFSALFFVTYPFVLWLTKQHSPEVPFMTILYAGLYVFWLGLRRLKPSWMLLLLAGCLVGIAMLVRGIAVGAGLVLSGLILALRRDLTINARAFLVTGLLLGNLLATAPWELWVFEQTGKVILLGTNGAPSIRDGLTFAVEAKNYRAGIVVPADVAALQQQFLAERASMTSLGETITVVAAHIRQQPLASAKLFLIKAARSWYATDSGRMESATLGVQLLYAIVVAAATTALWHRHEARTAGLLLFVSVIVCYFWIMTTLVLSILRYMAPTIGLLALLVPTLEPTSLRRAAPLRLR